MPASPLRKPTASEPSSRRCAPSVNDSCSTLPSGSGAPPEGVRAAAPPPTATVGDAVRACRSDVASSTAMMIAGDSISTIATVMWPPGVRPCDCRYCVAVTNVTALTDPYDAATAAASYGDVKRFSSV